MALQWYLFKNGVQSGPLGWEQLVEQGNAGHIKPGDFVWTEGMEDWIRADQLKGLITAPPPAPPEPFSAPKSGPPPLDQQQGLRNHRAGPVQRRGKGVLVALVIVLFVVLLGGGYFVASDLLYDRGNGVIAESGDETVTTENGQDSGGVSQSTVDTAGLWAPPLEYNQTFVDLMLEGGDTMADIQSQYNEFVAGIPKKGDVPYPPYPGAHVYGYSPGGMLNNIETLPNVVLLTADPVDSVLTFYKEQLQGFYHKDLDINIHYLWQGDADDEQDAVSGYIPFIMIYAPLDDGIYEILMPEAQALITIYYPPTN